MDCCLLECFHIRKLGRGRHTNDDEEALEFDLSKPGIFHAFADNDLSSCTAVETSVKMPEDSDFISKPGLLNFTYQRYDDIVRFNVSCLFFSFFFSFCILLCFIEAFAHFNAFFFKFCYFWVIYFVAMTTLTELIA